MQKDNFTSYLNTFSPKYVDPAFSKVVGAPTDDSAGLLKALTQIEFIPDPVNNVSLPIISRLAQDDTKYWGADLSDNADFGYNYSKSLNTILGRNRSGMALEKLIEIIPNANFYTNLSPSRRESLDFFLRVLFDRSLLYPNVVDNSGELPVVVISAEAGKKYRHALRNFLYESKLIMLFPQAMSIVDSLVETPPEGEFALWEKYSNSNFNVGIFSALFRFNFDPNFNKESLFDLTALTDISKEGVSYVTPDAFYDLYKDLDWTNYGKMYPDNFEALIKKFLYPFQNSPTVENNPYDPSVSGNPGQPYKNNQFNLFEGAPTIEWVKATVPTAGPDKKAHTNTWTGAFFKNLTGKFSPAQTMAGPAPATLTIEEYNKMIVDIYYPGPWVGQEEAPGSPNFLRWLYMVPVSSIMEINTVIRINSYIEAINPPGATPPQFPGYTSYKEFLADYTDSVSSPDTQTQISKTLKLLSEKSGAVRFMQGFVELEIPSSGIHYISFPLTTAKHAIPEDIKWWDWFVKINDFSYKEEQFYEPLYGEDAFDQTSSDINYALFPSLTPGGIPESSPYNQWPDVFSFFQRLSIMSELNPDAQKTKLVTKYKSTEWFNILGKMFTKEDILTHVESGENALKSSISGWWHDFTLDKKWGGDRLAYLTPGSKASLLELSTFFFQGSGDETQYKSQYYHSGDALYGSNGNSAANTSVLYTGEEFTMTNPATGKEIVQKKFIQIHDHRKNSNDNNYSRINYDFWYTGKSGKNYNWSEDIAEKLNEKYPGAEFDGSYLYRSGHGQDLGFHELVFPAGPGFGDNFEFHGLPGIEVTFVTGYINDPSMTQWAPGGLASSSKVEEPLDLSGTMLFNMYNMFERLMTGDAQVIWEFNLLLKCFFTKELSTIIAIEHKILMEKLYSEINDIFDPSKQAALDALFTAVAVNRGDYKHKTRDPSPFDNIGSIDLQSIAAELLKGMLGALANTVDPTWKTEWFLPGPFTPIGVTAKLLLEEDLFKGDSGDDSPPSAALNACKEEFTEQLEKLEKIYTEDTLNPPPENND